MDRTEINEARNYLYDYCKEHKINALYDLFDKDTLVENVNESDWEWSIVDEMTINGLEEDAAINKTQEWFSHMDKSELWDKICTYSQNYLIVDKAYDLGFEYQDMER